jgi:RNA-directed DNA polymerase
MPEPKDKLDTSVNGPEDPRPVFPAFDGDAWEHVDWRRCEEEVRRLRSRIFKAVQERDMATAVDLQKLMLRSWHNTLVSVRQVTQRNTGRKTAGIDGLVALTSQARAEMAVRVHATRGSHQPSPVRRVYIPKASDKSKMRPLGIPVILDRCHQARVRNALEPEWEARSEPRSYGFRPGRGCHDAIGSLFNTLRGKGKRVWILDADLAGAFDKIDHEHLLKAIGGFPARGMIAGWLRAGIFEAGKGYAPTEEGTPQGGVMTPPTQVRTWGRLRVVVAVRADGGGCGGVASCGDGVTDHDLAGADEDFLHEQAQDALAVPGGCGDRGFAEGGDPGG